MRDSRDYWMISPTLRVRMNGLEQSRKFPVKEFSQNVEFPNSVE